MSLKDVFMTAIADGLERKTIDNCAKWAEKYRVMGRPFEGPWTFDHHSWLLEMHNCDADLIVGQKAAQLGYTEFAMNFTFYKISQGHGVLYMLPTSSDASDFSSGRFDPALELSPHLETMFSDTNNVGLKRAGAATLYVRGSKSRSKLKSIPTGIIVMDEVDEMPKESVELAMERQSGQVEKQLLKISTPTVPDVGINVDYQLSTQDHFFFKCPSCTRLIELKYPESLVVTADSLLDPELKNSHLICTECNAILPHETKSQYLRHKDRGGTARFVRGYTTRDAVGFYVNQLYSSTVTPVELARKVIQARTDPTAEQELWNSKLGLAKAVAGAKITDQQIKEHTGSYFKQKMSQDGIKTLGVDIGAQFHVVVLDWRIMEGEIGNPWALNDYCVPRVLQETTVRNFGEVEEMMNDLGVLFAVSDAEPERQLTMRFANRQFGRVYLCDYLHTQTGRHLSLNEDDVTIKANRTAWIDTFLGRFKREGGILLPKDLSEEFKKHIKEPTRVYKMDKWGNPFGVYENSNADHFAHAGVYAEMALPFAATIQSNEDIRGLF